MAFPDMEVYIENQMIGIGQGSPDSDLAQGRLRRIPVEQEPVLHRANVGMAQIIHEMPIWNPVRPK